MNPTPVPSSAFGRAQPEWVGLPLSERAHIHFGAHLRTRFKMVGREADKAFGKG